MQRRDALSLLARGATALGAGAFASAALPGCAASSRMTRVESPQPLRPLPDQAVVVFVRPSSFGSALTPTILTSTGRFVGDADPSSHFAVAVPEGEHLFLVWGENTGPLAAQVLKGRVYFVEVAMKPGWWTARVHLLAIKPHASSWEKVRDWLADTKQTVPRGVEGQSYLDGRADDVAERVRRAKAAWADFGPEERDARTLRPDDGLAQAL